MKVVSNLINIGRMKFAPESYKANDAGLLVTANCILKCQTCTYWKKKHQDLPLEDIKKIVDRLKGFGIEYMCTTGGEPLLRKDIFEITDYIREKGIKLALVTNAFLYKKEVDEHYDGIYVSVDGPNAKVHDKIRGVKGSFARIENLLKNSDKVAGINFVVQKDNYTLIDEMYKLAEKYNTELVPFFYCSEGALGQPENEEMREFDLEKLEKTIETIKKKSPGMTCYAEHCFEKIKGNIKKQKCIVPYTKMMIDETGNVFPCSHFDKPIGNILEKPLKQIWEESKGLREQIRRGEYEHCKNCFSNELNRNFVLSLPSYARLAALKAKSYFK